MNEEQRITWEKTAQAQFEEILLQIPELIRGIAEVRVLKRAENIVRENNRSVIGEKDMVDAFFAETPGAFVSAMKNSMQALKIDYTKYGHQ